MQCIACEVDLVDKLTDSEVTNGARNTAIKEYVHPDLIMHALLAIDMKQSTPTPHQTLMITSDPCQSPASTIHQLNPTPIIEELTSIPA
jgi:hypothetical protein